MISKKKNKKSNLINSTYKLHDENTNQVYNYLWNPYTNVFEVYTDSELANQTEDNPRLNRIRILRQAIMQRLHFTVNPKVCKDDDGNYYDYDEDLGIFVKRD